MKEAIKSTTSNIYISFLIINKVGKNRLVWALLRLILYEALTNWNKEKIWSYFDWPYLPRFPLSTCVSLTNFATKSGNHMHSASNDTSNFCEILGVKI